MFVDEDWCFQWTYTESTITESLDSWLCDTGYIPYEIENEFTDEYEIVTPAPLMLKAWDLVDISKNITDLTIANGRHKDTIGMMWEKWLEIESVSEYRSYSIYTRDKSKTIEFPSRAVSLSVPKKELTIEERVKILEDILLKNWLSID